jgi:nucleoside-diphosphate-sugar epimerase
MATKALVVGCGYIGLPFALKLQKQGCEVSAWVHSQASADSLAEHAFKRVMFGSVADQNSWSSLDQAFDFIVHCASSSRGGPEAYQEVFFEGNRMMNTYQAAARRIFVSSTSVYGQTLGEVVTEESAAEPSTVTGRILREAEKIALESGTLVVRSSGIYGPGRGVLLEKMRRGEAVIEGDGLRWINQIHRDDLVGALLQLIEHGAPGQIYNASDDAPVTYRDFYAWCSDYLQKPMPPYGPVNTERKRGLSNKRVSNVKLRTLGWNPRYPSFREGISAYSPK